VAIAAVSTIPLGLLALALGYGARTTWLLVLLVLASVPLFLAQGYGIAFRAAEQMGRDAAVSVANKAIVFGIALPMLAVGGGIPGVILAQALAGGVALFVARALYPGVSTQPLSMSRQTARAMVIGGLPVLSMAIAERHMDAVILRLAPAAAVGYYGAARTSWHAARPAVILATASARLVAYPLLLGVQPRCPALARALGATGTFLFAETAVT
jgi:hypothetical protein